MGAFSTAHTYFCSCLCYTALLVFLSRGVTRKVFVQRRLTGGAGGATVACVATVLVPEAYLLRSSRLAYLRTQLFASSNT